MDIVSYSYRKPVTSGYRHTRVVGQTSYTTSDRPSQRVYVPARTYYDDWDATPSRSTVRPSPSYYRSKLDSRRYSISTPSSVSYRYRSDGDDLYCRPFYRSSSASRSSSLSSSYKTSSYNISLSRLRSSARSSTGLDYLNLDYRPYRSTDLTSSRVSARSLNHYAGFSSSYLLGSSSRSGLSRGWGDYACGYFRPSYCPSTYRSYYGTLDSAFNRIYTGGYSRLLDSLSLATPSTSVVHYKSYSSRGSSGLSSSSASSSLSRSSVGDYSYSGGSTGSWRRKYMDLDGQDDLDGPVTRRSRDSDEVYFDKMHKILSASPNVGVPPEPSCISGGVYLGTSADAENVAMMKAMRIQYILNCAGGVGVYSYKRVKDLYGPDAGIQGYEELYADDSETYDIRSCFDRAHAFLDHARSKNARVLIHCPGVSRSGAVAISWLLREGTPLLAATKMVKDKRRNALANTAFIRQLVSYARSRNQLDYDPTSVRAPTYHRVLHKARIMSAHLPLFV